MTENNFEEYNEVFEYIEHKKPDWEKLLTDGEIKIKTNQEEVQFTSIEEILTKFNLRITEISFSQYYGIVFGIEKISKPI